MLPLGVYITFEQSAAFNKQLIILNEIDILNQQFSTTRVYQKI